jgi:hypothetical protein
MKQSLLFARRPVRSGLRPLSPRSQRAGPSHRARLKIDPNFAYRRDRLHLHPLTSAVAEPIFESKFYNNSRVSGVA